MRFRDWLSLFVHVLRRHRPYAHIWLALYIAVIGSAISILVAKQLDEAFPSKIEQLLRLILKQVEN